MSKQGDTVREKISGCGLFIVLSTNGYLESLRRQDKNILNQISIARELKKPFVIIEDARMLQPDIEEIRKYFSKDNVVERVSVNMDTHDSFKLVAKKIRDVSRMFCPEESSINVVTLDPDKR